MTYLAEYEPSYVYGAVLALKSATLTDLSSFAPLGSFAMLYVVIPALIVGPPTFLMGVSFPFLQRACQSESAGAGPARRRPVCRQISRAALSGRWCTGWWLLPEFGTAATLRILVGLGALLAVPLWQVSIGRSRLVTTTGALAITVAVLTALPDGYTLWARLHGSAPHTVIAAEDGSGVSLLKPSKSSRDTAVFVNGIGQSWIPYGGIHTVLGALPALLHPDPQNIVIIGLGSGDIAFAAAGRQRNVATHLRRDHRGASDDPAPACRPIQPVSGA